MSSFDDINLEWEGKPFIIKSNRVLGAIARIEDVITLSELQRFGMRGGSPLAKIAMAYGAVLRYAGAQVTDEEVYRGLFSQGKKTSAETVMLSIHSLVSMMIPPMPEEKGTPPAGKAEVPAAEVKKTSSKKRSK
jgi:hypothetical protein